MVLKLSSSEGRSSDKLALAQVALAKLRGVHLLLGGSLLELSLSVVLSVSVVGALSAEGRGVLEASALSLSEGSLVLRALQLRVVAIGGTG